MPLHAFVAPRTLSSLQETAMGSYFQYEYVVQDSVQVLSTSVCGRMYGLFERQGYACVKKR